MKASFAPTLLAVALAPGLLASTQVQAVLYVNLDATGLTHDGSKGGGIETATANVGVDRSLGRRSECEGTAVVPALVTVQTAGPEQYVIRILDQDLLDDMIDRCLGIGPQMFVGCGLATGNGGHNRDPLNGVVWSWHCAEHAIGLGNVAPEICDGIPSFVEANLEYWIETVHSFCPWTGQIAAIEPDGSAAGDFDIDGDVDAADFALLGACMGGSGLPCYDIAQGCCAVDLNGDTDIDCSDWEQFMLAWTGPGDPPLLPSCDGTIPTVSGWGMVAMTLLLLTVAKLAFMLRQPIKG